MIYSILLLICLSCCVCAGSIEVNTTQSFYEAKENENITLEWTFPAEDDSSLRSLDVYCAMSREEKYSGLFRLVRGDEVPWVQHQQFAGRVHCDRKVLKEGQLKLGLSSLRMTDSGRYECEVVTWSGVGMGHCQLNVIEATVRHQTVVTAGLVRPKNLGCSALLTGPSVLPAVLLVGLFVFS
ncbi:coxsackievirus and adenovirus receptor homolog [Cheilinus undulatus]|uniref:coxsackievirus and adenovirus receptor homolog n=1 Tax=Cheilinus undulatus TaxID=241271 RepID=UPI001BD4DDAC|nr:coxsackievirus and adenovirus receptor homolog [Cheilinus undulatus]XP_041635803.1 coxsackievirus and adenovirus receptor homolog [Cheilinus undulatus]